MQTDFLILGGGVAGLSAANQMAERGADVALLESGIFPSHKICGEFISPEAVPLLEKWGIDLKLKINKVKLVTSEIEWKMELAERASSLPRYVLDEKLALRAINFGCQIKTNSFIKHIEFPKNSQKPFVVTLSSGEKWFSKTLLISTGKLVNSLLGEPFKPIYIGVKAHFEGIDIQELIMHISKNAYFGVSPIDKNKVNVAGIIAANHDQILHSQKTFQDFLKSYEALPLLKTLASAKQSFEFMVAPVPEFGVRHYPNWPNVYLLGDAAGVIAPATGNGLAMGLTSGILAADYAMKGQDSEYKGFWKKQYKPRIFKGMFLHRLFMSPKIVKAIPFISKIFPKLPNYCFKATRGKI